MKSFAIAAVAAAGLTIGTVGAAIAATPGAVRMVAPFQVAANATTPGQNYSGVGGNGSAKVKPGQNYSGVGGNGSAKKKAN